tara:strand:- start:389 stop:979 length:591 start_codon:yes stop_codon:yes gene_type:complete
MKKIKQSKVQRMRNLVTGDYTAKTQTRSGYKKYKNKKVEGEIWEENGKTWTIKNGIKQNFVKLKSARKYNKIPYSCPKCSTPLNKPQHKLMYKHHGHCLVCQLKVEAKMRDEGTYQSWVKENIEKNFNSWKENKRQQFDRWFSEIESKHHITEAGTIEDWSKLSSQVKQDIIDRFEKHLSDEENKMKEVFENNLNE